MYKTCVKSTDLEMVVISLRTTPCYCACSVAILVRRVHCKMPSEGDCVSLILNTLATYIAAGKKV